MRASPAFAPMLIGPGSTFVAPALAVDGGASPTDPGTPVTDTSTIGDLPLSADATVATLSGRWCLVGLEFDGEDRVRRAPSDIDSTIPGATGEPVNARAKGLTVVGDRLASAPTTLVNHFLEAFDTGFAAYGFAVTGLVAAVLPVNLSTLSVPVITDVL